MIKKKSEYGREALMDVFGTPSPSPDVVHQWRMKWFNGEHRANGKTMIDTYRLLNDLGIDPLYYHVKISGVSLQPIVVFYKQEHEVLFKLGCFNG